MATGSYTTQNDLLLNNLMEFYKDESNLNNMLKIITGESKMSLRIVDWFVTNYAKKYYTLFPIEVDKNHPPIIKAVSRGGLNLETNDNPIGLKNNSPIVITPYEEMNHQAEDLIAPFSLAITPAYITKQESAEMTNP